MSEHQAVNPKMNPELAAQEAVLALCEMGSFGIDPEHPAMGSGDGEQLADALIAVHRKLTAYYKDL